MKRLTNKLFISILTVAFAVIALGTTSFAWFTLGNTATISPFNATVTSGEGIEISLDGVNYRSTISSDEIVNGLLLTDFRFQDVTTADGSAFYYMDASGALVASTNAYDDGYIQFTLYFRSLDMENPAPSIYWTNTSVDSDGIPWVSDADFTDGKGASHVDTDPMTVKAANATRIGVFGTTNVIYELPASLTASTVIGNSDLGVQTAAVFTSATNGSVNYYFAKNQNLPAGSGSVTVPATVHNIEVGADQLDTTALLTLADTGATTGDQFDGTVTIRIWIEGWDPDCFNAILRDELTIGLTFSTLQN
jgi:hypothetical protein